VVAPFVAERVGLAPDRCLLLECRRCSHRFFDLALDDDEAERLYADYRGASYVEVRRRWEPWYSEGLNAAGAASATIEARRRLLRDYLRPLLPPDVLASGGILDYGGDRGQFIPPDLGGSRYVFDISGQPTHEGVLRVSQAGSLPLHRYDVVMLSHVLEHLTDPLDFLRRLPERLGPRSAGHWLYAEVPHERFAIWKKRAGEGGARVGAVPRRGLPWLARDFYSTLFRSKLGVVPPLGVIKLHEHQGFFTVTSLRTLLGRAGYAVVDSRVTSSGCSAPYRRVVRVLARHEREVAHAAPDPQGEAR
jgi:hypothetical protein